MTTLCSRLIVVLGILLHNATGTKPICCFPPQYEAFLVTSAGDVDTGSKGTLGYGYGFANGTLSIAFDSVTQRSFAHESSLSVTTAWPIPIPMEYTNIWDYKNVRFYF